MIERSLDVPTAEAVDLHYDLAGLGSRFLAVAIDTAIQFAAAFVLFLAIAFALAAFPGVVTAFQRTASGKFAYAILGAAIVFVIFALFFGYFIIFEIWWDGRTPGKRALGLRVIRTNGLPVDISGAVVRNVVRILEAGIGFYVASAICALRSPRNQRIGDYAAGTAVIFERAQSSSIVDELLTSRDESG